MFSHSFPETGFIELGIRALRLVRCRLSAFILLLCSVVRTVRFTKPGFLSLKSTTVSVHSCWHQHRLFKGLLPATHALQAVPLD